jgi:hypothetical protein
MEMRSTLTASLRAHAGAARPGVTHLAATHTGLCSAAYDWQNARTESVKSAIPVFHTDRPLRRPWEVSP